jgi:Flp pilus assembly protein TadG
VKVSRVLGDIKGQTLVEFALIITLLLALLFGITEFGRGWYYSNALVNGARAGARYASTLTKDANYETKVRNYTFSQITSSIPGKDLQMVNISAFDLNGNPRPNPLGTTDPQNGDAVEVIAYYNFTPLTEAGNLIPALSGSREIIRKAAMYYQGS